MIGATKHSAGDSSPFFPPPPPASASHDHRPGAARQVPRTLCSEAGTAKQRQSAATLFSIECVRVLSFSKNCMQMGLVPTPIL